MRIIGFFLFLKRAVFSNIEKENSPTDKSDEFYRGSFHSISLRLDISKTISDLIKEDIQNLIPE